MNTRVKKQSGFTLIEMMTVVAIVGIMAAIAVPSFNGMMQRAKLKAAGREIAMELILARATAISHGAKQAVSFNPKTGACDGTMTFPGKAEVSLADKKYSGIGFQHTSGDPIQFADKDGNATNDIIFNPDGTLENDNAALYGNAVGKIYLLDTRNSGNNKMTIEVNQFTGMVSLAEGWSP